MINSIKSLRSLNLENNLFINREIEKTAQAIIIKSLANMVRSLQDLSFLDLTENGIKFDQNYRESCEDFNNAINEHPVLIRKNNFEIGLKYTEITIDDFKHFKKDVFIHKESNRIYYVHSEKNILLQLEIKNFGTEFTKENVSLYLDSLEYGHLESIGLIPPQKVYISPKNYTTKKYTYFLT